MRLVLRFAACLLTVVAFSALAALAWDNSDKAAAQPTADVSR